MVDYLYSNYFYEHESSHLVIVNSDATVTGVVNDAPEIINSRYIITEVDIPQEKFSLDESLCSEDNLTFGLLEAARLNFTMYHYDDGEDVPNLTDEEIAVYIYFNGNSSNIFRVGTYIVKEDKYNSDRSKREINAYDVLNDLREFDVTKWYSAIYKNNTVRTVKQLRDGLFTWLNTPKTSSYLGIEGGDYDYTLIQDDTELVNDDLEIEQGIESDVITFGFVMQRLLEVNGVFAHVDRNGVIKYIKLASYDTAAVKVFDDNSRIPPLNYPDYHVWGIGYVRAIDRNNVEIAMMGSSAYKHPSIYNIIDSFVFSNNNNRAGFSEMAKTAVQKARDVMKHLWYYPFETKCLGNLCYEVGDRIDIEKTTYDDDDIPHFTTFYTYILERHFTGINGFRDSLEAKGERKQPVYKITNDRWHTGDGTNATSGSGSGGVVDLTDDWKTKFVKAIRNVGLRLLQEPSHVSVVYDSEDMKVRISWKDPDDLSTHRPIPIEWAGTVVVRKEGSEPWHIWDGEVLVDSTTRDEYLETPLEDSEIEIGKHYYYGIFPYHIAIDDEEHPIKHYRFTKVMAVDTSEYLQAPIIESITAGTIATWNGTELAILWSGDENSLTVQIDDGHIVFKMYSGETLIYTITSPVGSDVNDIKKIHIAFLEDENNHVAKPSFVYHTSNGYSYNQEEPTDAEMGLIYTWLQGGES